MNGGDGNIGNSNPAWVKLGLQAELAVHVAQRTASIRLGKYTAFTAQAFHLWTISTD